MGQPPSASQARQRSTGAPSSAVDPSSIRVHWRSLFASIRGSLLASWRLCVRFSYYGAFEYGKRVDGDGAIHTLNHSRGELSEPDRGFSNVRILMPGRLRK